MSPPVELPLRLRLAYGIWQGLAHLLLPFGLVYLWRRGRREPAYRAGLARRFGLWPRMTPGSVWIFAASAGETRAASPLVHRLVAAGHRVTLTHSTPAGLDASARLFADMPGVTAGYAPVDLFWAVRLFLSRVRPALGIVVEIELWPAMLIASVGRGVPMAHVNANLVDRSIDRDRARFGGMRMALYRCFTVICTKTPDFAARFRRIGIADSRVAVVGELKFDQRIDPAQQQAASALRATLGSARPVLAIASSVEGEESALMHLVERVLHDVTPRPRIVWVPRSPQRFAAVARALADRGLVVARRSECLGSGLSGGLPQDTDVLVGDSLGEMDFYMALADLVFVGASLIDHGGHNIMEPLAQGKPVLMGPSTFGIKFAADAAAAAGAFEALPDAAALGNRIRHLLSHPADLAAMTTAARGFTAHHTGAADRTMAALAPLLPPPGATP